MIHTGSKAPSSNAVKEEEDNEERTREKEPNLRDTLMLTTQQYSTSTSGQTVATGAKNKDVFHARMIK